MRALTVTDLQKKKYKIIPFTGAWLAAFGTPERSGVWFIWGASANGKTNFVLLLIKALALLGYRIIFNSLEEGASMTMQNAVRQARMDEVKRHVGFVQESMAELSERMAKPKSADVWIIDSYQYCGLSFEEYLAFRRAHPTKLIIFTSQAEGNEPLGRTARRVKFDADLKIWVHGFRAHSKGRYFGPNGGTHFTIWEEGAMKFYGTKNENHDTARNT